MGYVGFRSSTQPTEITCLPTQKVKGRNPTNYAFLCFLCALNVEHRIMMSRRGVIFLVPKVLRGNPYGSAFPRGTVGTRRHLLCHSGEGRNPVKPSFHTNPSNPDLYLRSISISSLVSSFSIVSLAKLQTPCFHATRTKPTSGCHSVL